MPSSEADYNSFAIKLLEENQTNIDLRIEDSVTQHELYPILHKELQTTEFFLNNNKNLPEWKKVVRSYLHIDNVPKITSFSKF